MPVSLPRGAIRRWRDSRRPRDCSCASFWGSPRTLDDPTATGVISSIPRPLMPAVRAVDMEEYVQRLRVAVGRLEDAFAARSLADVLADPALADCIGRDLADVYERLARHHAVPSGFRARNVAALLESTVRILASPACWYPASDVSAGMSPLVEPGAGDAGELRERRRVELIATEGPEGRVRCASIRC